MHPPILALIAPYATAANIVTALIAINTIAFALFSIGITVTGATIADWSISSREIIPHTA